MDDKNWKDKLQQELDFLKESFDADVISKEEFEKGKERVEQKLHEINNQINESAEEIKTPEEAKKSDELPDNENNEGPNTKSELAAKEKEESNKEPKKEKIFSGNESKNPGKENKIFMYAIVFVVLALIIFFFYSLINAGKANQLTNKTNQINFAPVCSADSDCAKYNANSVCINPGAKDAKCEIPQAAKTKVTVLNGRKECFNCDTQRILSLLESWFGTLDPKEVNYDTNDGKSLADKYSVNILPAYILDEKISNSSSFDQLKQIFIKKSDAYTLKEDAAGSTFYFRRENIPNKLDFFAKANDAASAKAEKNLQEFLNTFKNVQFEKHLQGDNLTMELNIRTFPTFLINNQVKFSGVQTADTIKTNFCSANKADECQKSLSKSLV